MKDLLATTQDSTRLLSLTPCLKSLLSLCEKLFFQPQLSEVPLEDKYMGYLTERVFLPLLQTTAQGLIDYHMPENGVFHNLIFAKN